MKLRDLISWILFIIGIIVSLWYLFGNSPTFEQAILILIITILFTITTKISDVSLRLNHVEKRFSKLEQSFIRLVDDFKKRFFKK